MKSVISLRILFLIAKRFSSYDQFATYLAGLYLNIPSTDSRCLDIKLTDLIKDETRNHT